MSHHPARKTWPPDLSQLSPKHQFRLERKYKRRAQLKWARPRWMAATRLAQLGAGFSVLVYGVLFMDAEKGEQEPFRAVRQSYREFWAGFWSDRRDVRRDGRREGRGAEGAG